MGKQRHSIKVPTATYNKIIFLKASIEKDLNAPVAIWDAIDAVCFDAVLRIMKENNAQPAPELLTEGQQKDYFQMVDQVPKSLRKGI